MPYPRKPRLPSPDPDGPGGSNVAVPTVQSAQVPPVPQAVAGAPRVKNNYQYPEMWDRPGRDVFNATSYPQRSLARPRGLDPAEVMRDHTPAVERLDSLLEEKMKTLLPQTVSRDPFWQRYSQLRKGFAAEMLADVVELLGSGQADETPLDDQQQAFVKNHPLTTWMNWIRPGGGSIIGK